MAELKDRVERLASCVDTHWLFASSRAGNVRYEVKHRLKIEERWWFYVQVHDNDRERIDHDTREDNAIVDSSEVVSTLADDVLKSFWTPAEVFEQNTGLNVFKGDVKDAELASGHEGVTTTLYPIM